jgi:hypothetical protein
MAGASLNRSWRWRSPAGPEPVGISTDETRSSVRSTTSADNRPNVIEVVPDGRDGGTAVRELEASLQQFGEFVLKATLVKEKAAPYCVRWVRRFLTRPASSEPVADQVRRFCEDLEREGVWQDWQVRQAEHALRIYFVNFLQRTDWHRRPVSNVIDEDGRTNPLAALEQLRARTRRNGSARSPWRRDATRRAANEPATLCRRYSRPQVAGSRTWARQSRLRAGRP